jgi:hypothetical protein
LTGIIDRLRAQFPELPNEQIDNAVHGSYGHFEHSAIREYVQVLVERSARAQLTTTSDRHRA